MALHAAGRFLAHYPGLAQHSFYTAIVCGNIDYVKRALHEQPLLARQKGGPKGWEPLHYLCFTRLNHPPSNDNAPAMARLLLEHGAHANAYFMAGDSLYTPFTGVVGEGEEDRPPHARRDELMQLLFQFGAEPFDVQVFYNVHFHGDIIWLLEAIYAHTLELGRGDVWSERDWPMIDMGGYGLGARYLMTVAINKNDLRLARWLLEHGANPNAAPATDPRWAKTTLHEEAMVRGRTGIADLLVQYGAPESGAQPWPDPWPLHSAAKTNNVKEVARLLDEGYPIEAERTNGCKERPLHDAAYANALDTARLLLERGAEIDPVETCWDNTPLGGAAHYWYTEMMELLGNRSSDIWQLVWTGNVNRVRALLQERPELARTAGQNETLLMWLPDPEDRALAMARLLVDLGADVKAVHPKWGTAAEIAARRGMLQVARLLS
jgi:uncharacterized protein